MHFWSSAIIIIAAYLFYDLKIKSVNAPYRPFTGLILIGLSIWVCLVILGFVSIISLVLISAMLVLVSFALSPKFFNISRLNLFWRLFFATVLVISFFELASLTLFNVPVALNLRFGPAGLHWSNVELGFANLFYPFLPSIYFLFIVSGIAAFFVKLSQPTDWLRSRTLVKKFGLLISRLRMFRSRLDCGE